VREGEECKSLGGRTRSGAQTSKEEGEELTTSLLELQDTEDESAAIIRNVGNYWPVDTVSLEKATVFIDTCVAKHKVFN
jgi:hypothetical protein